MIIAGENSTYYFRRSGLQTAPGMTLNYLQTKLAASLVLPLPLYTASCG